MLGTLFRPFDNLAVFNVEPEDIKHVDYFSTCHPTGSRALKIAAKRDDK